MIAVTFALPSESSAFLSLLENRGQAAPDSHSVSGTLHGHRIGVLHTGVGERSTRERLETFLHREKLHFLISAGFAGALNPRFQIGDILLAENFSDDTLAANAQSLSPSFRGRAGRLATAPGMIDSLIEREELGRSAGADAVDMETSFIAEACAAAGISMLSLRAISDTPEAPFPVPPEMLFDVERQKTDYWRLLLYLARNPAAVGGLISFAQRIRLVRHSLAGALDAFIARI